VAVVTPQPTIYNGGTSVANTTVLQGVIAGTTVAGNSTVNLASSSAGVQPLIYNGTALSGTNSGDYVVTGYMVNQNANNTINGNINGSNNGGNATPANNSDSGATIVVQPPSATPPVIDPPQFNNMAIVVNQLVNDDVYGPGETEIDNAYIDAGGPLLPGPREFLNNRGRELIYVRDADDKERYLANYELPESGAFKFPVPDKIVQDLINQSGEGLSANRGKSSIDSYKLLLVPNGAKVLATTVDDKPLPAGLTYNLAGQYFSVSKMSEIALPMEIKLTLKQGNKVLGNKVLLVTK
jgi:hypothetical protein